MGFARVLVPGIIVGIACVVTYALVKARTRVNQLVNPLYHTQALHSCERPNTGIWRPIFCFSRWCATTPMADAAEAERCPICHDPLGSEEAGAAVQAECGHLFCSACLLEWLVRSRVCDERCANHLYRDESLPPLTLGPCRLRPFRLSTSGARSATPRPSRESDRCASLRRSTTVGCACKMGMRKRRHRNASTS